jgi:catechol 2,3-dioxygenase-like lactoylglutathione lyase family enzyme
MAYVVVSDLDRAVAFYVDTLGAEVVRPASARRPCEAVLRPPGEHQCLTLVEVRESREGAAVGSEAEWALQADIELSRVAGATPDDAGLWRTPRGDVVAWFRDHAGGISSLNLVA